MNTIMVLFQRLVDILEDEAFDFNYSYDIMGHNPDVSVQIWPYNIYYQFAKMECSLWYYGDDKESGRWEMTPQQYVSLCKSFRVMHDE